MSCSADSLSPDYKVLHRAIPIAWPISFMEGDIVKMQLIFFYHGNENVTVVGKESLVGRQREPMVCEMGVTSLQAPRGSPSASTAAAAERGWLPRMGVLWRGEPWPLAKGGLEVPEPLRAGGSSWTLRVEDKDGAGWLNRQGHSATQ